MACIMTSRYFILAKNDFMSDWKLLDAMNDNDDSRYPREKKRKKEMHTHHVRNSYSILSMPVNSCGKHLTPGVWLKDVPQDNCGRTG